MNAFLESYRYKCLGFLAWVVLTLSAGIVLGMAVIIAICSPHRTSGLDPLPRLTWGQAR